MEDKLFATTTRLQWRASGPSQQLIFSVIFGSDERFGHQYVQNLL